MHRTPDLVENVTPLIFGANKKQGVKKDQETLLRARWIGKTYRLRRESSTELMATHPSPRTHWRRGNYKRVPIGERSIGKRKWVWIEPWLTDKSGEKGRCSPLFKGIPRRTLTGNHTQLCSDNGKNLPHL